MSQSFNDRAIPASERYKTAADFRIPEQEPIRPAETAGTATLRMGRYLHMMTTARKDALLKELRQPNFDTGRHVDDRVERCQEDI